MADNGMLCRDAEGDLVFAKGGSGGAGIKSKAYIANNIAEYTLLPTRMWVTVKTHALTAAEKSNLTYLANDYMLIYNLDESPGSCFSCDCTDVRGRVDLQTRLIIYGSAVGFPNFIAGYLHESGCEMALESVEHGGQSRNLGVKIGQNLGYTVFGGFLWGGDFPVQIESIVYQFNTSATTNVKDFNCNNIRIAIMQDYAGYTNVYNSPTE